MTHTLSSIRINAQRFKTNFEALSRIGATAAGGAHRPALSVADLEARAWLRERIEAAGLEYACRRPTGDAAGNQSALLRGSHANAPHFLLGSHLDTVPNGGRFDGTLGVLAALEVLQTLKESGYSPPVNFEAINFTDEEGTHIGLLGSRALTGKLTSADLGHPNLGIEAFESGLTRLSLTRDGILGAYREPDMIAGYLELHIEQGPTLAESGEEIGIVTAIVGIRRLRLRFIGRADHAGTTPIPRRRDAGRAACTFAAHAWEAVLRDFTDCVINVGNMRFEPGIFNVVPEAVMLDLELRASSNPRLATLHDALVHLAQQEAKEAEVELEISLAEDIAAAVMDSAVQGTLIESAQSSGRKYRLMPSSAGHDAQSFADICPTGMLFIPSVAGASHSPKEFSHWQDCVKGANLLLQAALRLTHVPT
jgi:N-carbamoyl-L-amino-acid hydrolase